MQLEARGKVDYSESSLGSLEPGLKDVAVLLVALRPGAPIGGTDGEAAAVGLVQERAEDRLGVEARQAAPHHGAGAVDER